MTSQPAPPITTATAPTLTVGDLRLIPFTDSDAADLFTAVDGDTAVARFSFSLSRVHDVDGALAWMASRRGDGEIDWGVRDPDGQLVGRTTLHDIDLSWGVAEIGYTVFAAYRRRGIARRITQATTAYAFDVIGLERLALMHAVPNEASCAVATTCGFAFEGVMRSILRHPEGGREDAHLHARLRADPPLEF